MMASNSPANPSLAAARSARRGTERRASGVPGDVADWRVKSIHWRAGSWRAFSPRPIIFARRSVAAQAPPSLDLNGFTIASLGGTAGDGIYLDPSAVGEIRNGTIRGFPRHGIFTDATPPLVGPIRLSEVRALKNGEDGMKLARQATLVEDCSFVENGGAGISVWLPGALVVHSVFWGNVGIGLIFQSIGTSGGYLENAFAINGSGGSNNVGGGTNLGHNLCNNVLCP